MPDHIDEIIANLHDQAIQATGLTRFGSDDYLPAMRVLIASMMSNYPSLNGETPQVLGLALMPLILRLKTEESFRNHPEYRDVQVDDPVVIVGMPRTGTTALHGFLSVDPQYQVLERWLQSNPQPRPPRETWDSIPEYQQVSVEVEMTPDFIKRTHYVLANEGDECLAPMAQTFVSNMFGSQINIPEYDAWFLKQDMTPSFRRYADFLRLIGLTSPNKVWLLKNPSHVFCLDELFAVFPNAKVIQTHRDPQVAIGSVVSLLTAVGEMLGQKRAAADMARREIDLWAEGMRRSKAARNGRESSFYDVDYREFVSDPLAVTADIYNKFGIELTQEATTAMRSWIDAHPQNLHGKHSYNPEDLGVTRALVNENFGSYLKEYNL